MFRPRSTAATLLRESPSIGGRAPLEPGRTNPRRQCANIAPLRRARPKMAFPRVVSLHRRNPGPSRFALHRVARSIAGRAELRGGARKDWTRFSSDFDAPYLRARASRRVAMSSIPPVAPAGRQRPAPEYGRRRTGSGEPARLAACLKLSPGWTLSRTSDRNCPPETSA